eukprot:TRINITY_DN18557_c0_g1_i1.p1 TRINITY_DN18557_c0_g1~~TRINITY_DN18557_c0_g1_i1.p1  ORF type:complete len:749 (+),score=114.59 TRINITY_DN18557_c0_g1_i1:55-2301(+)
MPHAPVQTDDLGQGHEDAACAASAFLPPPVRSGGRARAKFAGCFTGGTRHAEQVQYVRNHHGSVFGGALGPHSPSPPIFGVVNRGGTNRRWRKDVVPTDDVGAMAVVLAHAVAAAAVADSVLHAGRGTPAGDGAFRWTNGGFDVEPPDGSVASRCGSLAPRSGAAVAPLRSVSIVGFEGDAAHGICMRSPSPSRAQPTDSCRRSNIRNQRLLSQQRAVASNVCSPQCPQSGQAESEKEKDYSSERRMTWARDMNSPYEAPSDDDEDVSHGSGGNDIEEWYQSLYIADGRVNVEEEAEQYEARMGKICRTMADMEVKTSKAVHDFDFSAEALEGVTGYRRAQKDMQKCLDQESSMLVDIGDAATTILRDKRRERGKADRLFGNLAQITAEVAHTTGLLGAGSEEMLQRQRPRGSRTPPRQLPSGKRRSSAVLMAPASAASHNLQMLELLPETVEIEPVLRRASIAPSLPDEVDYTFEYVSTLAQQAAELSELTAQNCEYNAFMVDCLRIQAIMFNEDDIMEEIEGEEDALMMSPRDQSYHNPRTKRRETRFSIRGLLPSNARAVGKDGKVPYTNVNASKYLKTRKHLMRQLRAEHEREQGMLTELAKIIGLKEIHVEQLDPHSARPRTDEWLLVEHLPKEFVKTDEAFITWSTQEIGAPEPKELYVTREQLSALLFFPTYFTHGRGGRLLSAVRSIPIKVKVVYPCQRCYAAVAKYKCETCGTWQCHFCDRLSHQAAGTTHHEVVLCEQ